MITTKPMTVRDLKAAHKIAKESLSTAWSEVEMEKHLDNPYGVNLVAIEVGEVVGFLSANVVLETAALENIAVRKTARQRGVGKQLLVALIDRIAQRGGGSLTLEVRPSNRAACNLYQSCGFTAVGWRKGFYRNPAEDALILAKQIKREKMDENTGN